MDDRVGDFLGADFRVAPLGCAAFLAFFAVVAAKDEEVIKTNAHVSVSKRMD
jgi:hypothetical protein